MLADPHGGREIYDHVEALLLLIEREAFNEVPFHVAGR